MKTWIIPAGIGSGPSGLKLVERPSPTPAAGQVRLTMKAWSTNYRDGAVAGGLYLGGPVAKDTIPLSDGAGVVAAVGAGVTRWKVGDRVAPTFFQNWIGGPFTAGVMGTDLGGPIDGVLAEEIVIDEQGLVRIPDALSFQEAASLPCAAVTAWHALFASGHVFLPGQTVLVLGTGGVSIFALQFAKAAGARVIATSSSDAKLEHARRLGADQTVNYRSTPAWDEAVLKLTDGRGVDMVIEVGGPGTLARSMNAVAAGGTVALIGILAGFGGEVSPLSIMLKTARLQGVYVGSRAMFEAMNTAIASQGIRPVIDKVFAFEDAPGAYLHQAAGGHVGKVVIAAE